MDIGPWEIFGILVAIIVVLTAWRFAPSGSRSTARETRAMVAPAPVAAPEPPPVICPACQTPNVATNRFCSGCGGSLAPQEAPAAEEKTCPSCATVNPAGQTFCGQCGTRLTPAAA
jgi:Double zinc ribbon